MIHSGSSDPARDGCDEFSDELIAILPRLGPVRAAENASWAPERPPDTVLFSLLGWEIVSDWTTLEAGQKAALSSAIERAATGQDKNLRTVVLMGLVEAMLNAAQGDQCSEKDVLAFLGVSSRRHAIEWMSFHGCPTHGYRN